MLDLTQAWETQRRKDLFLFQKGHNRDKVGNPAVCDNMDEPGGDDTEGNQAVAEGPTLPDSSFEGSTWPGSGKRSRERWWPGLGEGQW